MTDLSVEDKRTRAGDSYTVDVNGQTGSGGSHELTIENPADSGVRVYIFFAGLTHSNDVNFIVHDSFSSAPTGGSAANVNNNLIGSAQTSAANCRTGDTYTADGQHQTQNFRAQYVTNVEQELFDGYRLILQEDTAIVLEVTDPATNNPYASMRVAFYEERLTYDR